MLLRRIIRRTGCTSISEDGMSASELAIAVRYYRRLVEDTELADWQRAQAQAILARLAMSERLGTGAPASVGY